MAEVFNTPYWREHGGVLPGWIIGTAGAVRYPLPPNTPASNRAMTNVYGVLIGTVHADEPAGELITFDFVQVHESDVPAAITKTFGASLIEDCFRHNTEAQ
jgi:hypothetical protein